MRLDDPKRKRRRRLAFAGWLVIAVSSFAAIAVIRGSRPQFGLAAVGCSALLCIWAANRWPNLL